MNMSNGNSRRFSAEHLERTINLFEEVEAHRWVLNAAPAHERQLVCELWVCKARAFLEEDLSNDDKQACLWVLHVVRGIARSSGLYIKGLGRNDRDDWASRARAGSARLRARRRSDQQKAPPKPKTKAANNRTIHAKAVRSFPNLVGATFVVVGGEQEITMLDRYRNAGMSLIWVPASVRQIEACADRVRRGGVDGVIFLTDRNSHSFQKMLRNACRASGTAFEFSATGTASIEGALEKLNERREPMPESA